jgi:hypothetical protein
MAIPVNADNFVRAETHRMFADIQREAGGVGVFRHNRQPASIDEQTVIRMNRDTCTASRSWTWRRRPGSCCLSPAAGICLRWW